MTGKHGVSVIAGYGSRGSIWINKHVPETYRGIDMRARLKCHERVERELRLKYGLSYRQAHKAALKPEHEGLTKKQIAIYEGKLGSIARHHPRRR